MTRVRAQIELDRDEVSPTSLIAAQKYLVEHLEHQAEHIFARPKAINWETFHTYVIRRKAIVQVVAWAKVVK